MITESNDITQLLARIPAGDYWDHGFLAAHSKRYAYFLKQLQVWLPQKSGTSLLEMGSYHLHLSILMSQLGYTVKGVDLPVFTERPVVAARAVEFGIENRPYQMNRFGVPAVIPYPDSSVNAVVCTEVLEHITFNPIRFWSEVYRVIQDGGLLLLTTPNSFRLFNILAQLKRLLTFQCIGLDVKAILGGITSGHHWKEYSLREIKGYFQRISPDFELIGHEYYSYREYGDAKKLYQMIYWFEERMYPKSFRPELFIVFRVCKKRGITIADPDSPVTTENSSTPPRNSTD